MSADSGAADTIDNPKRSLKPISSASAVLVILIFSAALYAGSINAFFVADDLWQVHYQYRTVAGEWDLLLANFTGTYLGIPGTNFYRPVLGISFLIDYLISGANSTGYHLTSILLHAGNSLLVFYLGRFFEKRFLPENDTGFAPLAAALLFAATPLHCEAVSWISGRADPLFTLFFLLSYLLFLLSIEGGGSSPSSSSLSLSSVSTRTRYILSLCGFIFALQSKETAVVLPLLIALSVFPPYLFAGKSVSNKERLNMVAPYVAIALGYLLLRLALFGDFAKGYVGTFGEGMARTAAQRILDWRIWVRTALPFNTHVINSSYVFLAALLAVSVGVFSSIAIILDRGPRQRLLAFLLLWALISLLPLIGFFNIDEVLHGSRVFYLFSAPMLLFLGFSLFPGECKRKLGSSLRRTAFVVLLLTYATGTAATNRLWKIAGDKVAAIKEECLILDRQFGGRQPIVVLGIPGDYYGAFVLLNGSTIHHLFSPPFTREDISARIYSFKPFIFGSESNLDSTRFKRVLGATASESGMNRVYFAGVASTALEGAYLRRSGLNSVSVSGSGVDDGSLKGGYKVEAEGICRCKVEREGSIVLNDMVGDTKLRLTGLDLFPLDYDFLSMRVSSRALEGSNTGRLLPLSIGWNDSPGGIAFGAISSSSSSSSSASAPLIRIGLSQYWKWYRDMKIRSLELNCGAASRIEFSDIELLKDIGIRPILNPPSLEERSSGEFVLRDRRRQIAFDCNLNGVEPVAFLQIEVTRPNCFFEGLLESGQAGADLAMTRKVPASEGGFTLPVSLLREGAYSQVRVLCLDKQGRPLGVHSDPITIFLNLGRPNPYLY